MASDYYDSFSPQPESNNEHQTNFQQLQQANTLTTNTNGNTTIPSTTDADLSYRHNARGHSLNNPPPNGWIYPHKKGIGTKSNLESFKEEIEARTQKGENCKAIAEALNAMGVQTSDRAVSRVRIKWGMRKRAQRKVRTPPPGSEAARLSAKSKVQALRKSELIRMTKEGMPAEEICRNLTRRGMELKKGVATVLRLQSAWGLAHDEKRWLGNFRHQCHKKARAQQVEAFSDIAAELDVQDVEGWIREKMSKEVVRQARHELALKLMGEHAPSNPERRKLQAPRRHDDPHVKPTDVAEFSDREIEDSDTEGDADSPAPVRRLRSGAVDPSSRKAEFHMSNVASSSKAGDSDGMFMDQPSYPGGGMGTEVHDGHTPLDDQRDDDMHDAEDDDDETNSAAHVGARVFQRDGLANTQSSSVSRPIRMYDPQRLTPARAASSPTLNSSRPTSEAASATSPYVADSSMDSSEISATPGKRYTGRPPKQSAAKSDPIPEIEAPTRSFTSPDTTPKQASRPATRGIVSSVTAATTASPMTSLILRTEEAEANKSTLSTLDQYNVAATVYKELLEARTENRPLPGSLTGLPPSAKEVDTAKFKLKEATQAMMLALD